LTREQYFRTIGDGRGNEENPYMTKPRPHTFKVKLPGDLAEYLMLKCVKSGRSYQGEFERALRSYYKLKK
jgi:hypothetical protein